MVFVNSFSLTKIFIDKISKVDVHLKLILKVKKMFIISAIEMHFKKMLNGVLNGVGAHKSVYIQHVI